MKYKEGKRARRGTFQNCLAGILILAHADNPEQFDELACLCCRGRGGGGKKAARRGEEQGEELGLLPLASCQNCLADMLFYADVGSYEQFEE